MQDRKFSVGVGDRGLMILKRCSGKALRIRYDMKEAGGRTKALWTAGGGVLRTAKTSSVSLST